MIRRLLLVVVACFLGTICESIWGEPVDFGFPVFIFICLCLGVFGLLIMDALPDLRSVFLFFPPLIFSTLASLTAFQPQSLKHLLSLVFTYLFIALLAMTYLGGRLNCYSLFDYLLNFLRLLYSMLVRPFVFLRDLIRDALPPAPAEDDGFNFAQTIGILTLVSLVGLFCLADIVFRQVLRTWFTPGEGPNIFAILLWTYLILGVLLHAATQSRDTRLLADDPRRFRHWLNYNLSAMAFVTALVPLFAFSFLRFICFANNGICLDDSGFPAVMDSRYGYWAMVAASVIVFLLVCWLNHVTVFSSRMDRDLHTLLNSLIFANAAFLLLAAWINVSKNTLWLSEDIHVWYARGVLLWLGSIFALFIGLAHFERERDFPFFALMWTTAVVIVFITVALAVGAV